MLRVFKDATIATAFTLAVFSVTAFSQGRYVGTYTKANVEAFIKQLETSSDRFRRDFDRSLDQSSLNGTNTEDRLNGIVRRYEQALDRLRRDYDNWDSWWESRRNVGAVMDESRAVNNMMNSLSFKRSLENQWRAMRNDINKLADTYDLPGLNGGGWNGGGGWGGSGSGGSGSGNNWNIPGWAIGSYYTKQSNTGRTLTLSIQNNGRVTMYDGATRYGTISGTQINVNGVRYTVSSISGGIRTRRNSNGAVVNYRRR